MSAGHKPQLDYAPKPKPWRRSQVLTRLALSAVVLGAAAWAVRSGPDALRRWQWSRLYRQCATHSAPADQVVYEQDPAAAAALLRRKDFVALPALVRPEEPAAGRAVPEWENLRRLAGFSPTARPVAVLFLHRMRAGRSSECFVWVAFTGVSDGYPEFDFDCMEFGPDAAPGTGGKDGILGRQFAPGLKDRSLRFYAGQADPSDPSHFTIAYEMTGGRGTIDGWLKDHADSVWLELNVRNGPAAVTE